MPLSFGFVRLPKALECPLNENLDLGNTQIEPFNSLSKVNLNKLINGFVFKFDNMARTPTISFELIRFVPSESLNSAFGFLT